MMSSLRHSLLYFALLLFSGVHRPQLLLVGADASHVAATAAVNLQGDVWTATETTKTRGVPNVGRTTSSSYPTEHDNIRDYLNPALFDDPATLWNIQSRLRNGHAVVIRNAFRTEFAEAMHAQLMDHLERFQLHVVEDENMFFTCHHHNIYHSENFTDLMEASNRMFESEASKEFMKDLTGRECSGPIEFSASWFQPGDSSMPHHDWHSTRSVAYVWHLTKNWKDGYGGALYWCNEHPEKAYIPPSFNTLVLFNVNAYSHHLVTAVNPLAGDNRRLAINGWYTDEYEPSFDMEFQYDIWEDYYNSREKLMELTADQYVAIEALAEQCWTETQPEHISEERCANVQRMADFMTDELMPDDGYQQSAIIDL